MQIAQAQVAPLHREEPEEGRGAIVGMGAEMQYAVPLQGKGMGRWGSASTSSGGGAGVERPWDTEGAACTYCVNQDSWVFIPCCRI